MHESVLIMIDVRKELCRGCGLCVNACPRGAITVESGKAEISRELCDECMSCLTACPNRAIVSTSQEPLKDTAMKLSRIEAQLKRMRTRLARLERHG